MSLNRYTFTVLLCLLFTPMFSQGVSSKVFKYIEKQEYAKALEILDNVKDIKDNSKALHARALVNFYTGENQRAITDIARTKILGNKENALNYYLAKIYQKQRRYKDAIKWYKKYLKGKEQKIASKEQVINEVNYCINGLYSDEGVELFIDHLPKPVNSQNDESNIIRSPLYPSSIYLTRNDKKGSDISSYVLKPNGWQKSNDILPTLESKNKVVMSDISQDGQVFFFHTKMKKRPALMFQTSVQREKIKKANMPYFPDLGDKDICIVNHETILFASLRPGGYGGYDIYFSNYENNLWSEPKNLGKKINSSFNDVSPFLTADGKYLFFSSDNSNSIGGYDIFYSEKNDKGFSNAKNVGTNLNSPDNDLYFNLEQDGVTSSFCSDRDGTIGGLDVFFGYFKEKWEVQIVEAQNLSFIDYEKPIDLGEIEEVLVETQNLEDTTQKPVKKESKWTAEDEEDLLVVVHEKETKNTSDDVEEIEKKIEESIVEESFNDDERIIVNLEKESIEEEEEVELLVVVHKEAEVKKVEDSDPIVHSTQEINKDKELDVFSKEDRLIDEEEIVVQEQSETIIDKNSEAFLDLEETDEGELTVIVHEPTDKIDEKTEAKDLDNQERKTEKEKIVLIGKKKKRKNKKKKKDYIDPTTVLTVKPLFYVSDKQILSLENEGKLNDIIHALKLFPDAGIELTNFINPGPLKEFELWFGISWASTVVDYLLKHKISKDRIRLNTVGASYPFALREAGGKQKAEYVKMNQRIDMQFFSLPEEYSATYLGLDIPSKNQDRRYSLYKLIKEDVHFRVEFARSKRIFKHAILRYYDDIMVTKNIENEELVYTIGFYESFEKALDVQKELESNRFMDTKIVVMKGSEKLSKSEIKKLSSKNEDLKRFVDQSL